MKEVWYFLKWKWAQFTITDKLWFLGAFFIGSASYNIFTHPHEPMPLQAYIGFGLWFCILLKWFVVDAWKDQWQRYQKEKASLLNVIKDGK